MIAVETVKVEELGASERALWQGLRDSNPQLASPYFDLRYVDVAARFAPEARIAVIRRDGCSRGHDRLLRQSWLTLGAVSTSVDGRAEGGRADLVCYRCGARVHVSVMDTPEVEREVLRALEHTEPFLHRTLLKRLHMRTVPHLRFLADHSIAEGDRIATLLREVAHEEGREL